MVATRDICEELSRKKQLTPKAITFKNRYMEIKEVQQQDSQISNSSKKKNLKRNKMNSKGHTPGSKFSKPLRMFETMVIIYSLYNFKLLAEL